MSDNQAKMTLQAVLELKDRLTGKIKTVNKSLDSVKVASTKAGNAIDAVKANMDNTSKSAAAMSRGVDRAKQSLQGVKGTYSATLGLKDNATAKAKGVKTTLEGIRGKVYTATVNIRQNGLGKVKSSLSNLAGGALMGTSLQMAGAAGIGFGAYNAIKSYMDFEQEMSKVGALSGATGAEFDALTAKAQQMGATTMFTAKQSAEALSYMGMAGWNTQQMLDGIDGVMNLAAASGEELGRVSDIVTDALTAFGLKAADAGHFSDVLAKASSKSNTNVSMMGMTFKYVAPMAGALKYSVEDVATAIGLMANAGIKGEQAGTSLRAVMTRLVAPPKTAANAMTQLGIEVKRADGTMKPWMETMKDLRKAFAGLSEADKTKYASMLAGQEAMSGFLAIVNATEGDFETLTKEIQNSNGAAKEMADKRMDNLAGDVTYLASAWDGLTQKIMKGSGAAGGLRDFVKGIKELVETFNSGLDEGLGTAILDTTAKAVTDLKDKFLALDGVGSILAGGALAGGLYKIFDLTKKVGGGIRDIVGSPGGKTGGVSAGKTVGEMTVNAATVIVNGSASSSGGVPDVAGGTGKAGSKPSGWKGKLKAGGKLIGGGAALSALFAGLDIYSTRQTANKRLADAQTNMAWAESTGDAALQAQARANLDSTKAANDNAMAASIGGGVGGTIGAVAGGVIGTAVGGPVGTVVGGAIGGAIGDAVGEAIATFDWGNEVDYVGGIISNEFQYLGGVLSNEFQYWGDIANTGFEFIVGCAAIAWEQIEPYWGAASDWFSSTVWQPISNEAEYIWNGITNNAQWAWDGVTGLWGVASGWFDSTVWQPICNGVESAKTTINGAFESALSYVKGIWAGIGSWFDANVVSPIKAKFSALSEFGSGIAAKGRAVLGRNASGTSYWNGGLTEINEHGGEIVDLPAGSRVYPHATTMKMLNDAITSSDGGNTTTANVTITGNTFTVREEADIDKIAYRLQQLIAGAQANYNPT